MKTITLRSIPVTQLELDPDNPRKPWGTTEDNQQLRESIRHFGVLDPILVMRVGSRRYLVIDGQRRLQLARQLGHRTIDCVVHPKMDRRRLMRLRWDLEVTFKPLTKAEQSRQRRRIRDLGLDPETGSPLSGGRKAA